MTPYAPSATHAPHHVPAEWIARWKGKFDQGWDKLRQETLARQIQAGVVPAGTKLAPKPDVTQPMIISADETADVGIDLGTPVVEAIGAEAKSRFTGRIPKDTIQSHDADAS